MKKIISLISFTFAASFAQLFALSIDYVAGGLYDKNGNELTSGKVAFILDLSGGNFENFSLEAGDIISIANGENTFRDFQTVMYTDIQFDTDTNSYIGTDFKIYTLDAAITNKNLGLLIMTSGGASYTANIGDEYGFYTPQIGVDNYGLSDADARSNADVWNTGANNAATYFVQALTDTIGFNIPKEALGTSRTVIPEPSTYAAIFGALALCIAFIKRRKL